MHQLVSQSTILLKQDSRARKKVREFNNETILLVHQK